MSTPRRTDPAALWDQARSEVDPSDADAVRRRYRELMGEHGHLISGEPEPLACGWPHSTRTLRELGDYVAATSKLIADSYPPDLCREAVLSRKIGKAWEEGGEAWRAWMGSLGENPRKGVTHTENDTIEELLDMAATALGAVEEFIGHTGASTAMLLALVTRKHARLREAIGASS